MKTIRLAVAAAIMLLACAFLFSCGNGDAGETTAATSVSSPTLVSATGFAFDGAALTMTVSNDTTEISFADRFTFDKPTDWRVQQGEWADEISLAVASCPLREGDNRFTLGAFSVGTDGGASFYSIVIHRRSLYTVSFDCDGGTAIPPLTVEEDAPIPAPAAPTRTGYSFVSWDCDFSKPIKGNLTVTAKWTPDTDVPYTVEYYLENAAGTGYDKTLTEPKTGAADASVTGERKAFAHYAFSSDLSTESGSVAPDGSLVLKLYYTREVYAVTFLGGGGTLQSGNATQTVRYGDPAVLPTFRRDGYAFAGWNDAGGCDAVSQDLTVTAQWTPNVYSVTYVPNGGVLGGSDPATYTAEDDVTLSAPTRALYEFSGWYDQVGNRVDNLAGHFGNLTLTARWTPCITVSEAGEITGILDSFRASVTALEIPSESGGVAIVSVGAGAFSDCPNLVSVTVPAWITAIGEGAFKNCPALASVVWNAVECEIAGSDSDPIFSNCPNLSSVTFGDGVLTLPGCCFYGCSGLSTVGFNDGIESIGVSAFSDCASLAGIVLPEGLLSIGSLAFHRCDALTSIVVPDNVTGIGDGAFSDCAALASVVIGEKVAEIGLDVFRGCPLTEATILGEGDWYVSQTKGATEGTDLTVSNAAQNAARLRDAYCSFYWYKN